MKRAARRPVAILLAFAAAAVLVVVLFRRGAHVSGPVLPPAAAVVVPDTATALRALVDGTNETSPVAALPLLRTAVVGLPQIWEARYNLASALENAALESGLHLGRSGPMTRSSIERVALVTEGLREREVAVALARSSSARAATLWNGAKVLRTWGMPVDALQMARRAQALDPTWPESAKLVTELEYDLQHDGAAR